MFFLLFILNKWFNRAVRKSTVAAAIAAKIKFFSFFLDNSMRYEVLTEQEAII